jgi:hypothetical protein
MPPTEAELQAALAGVAYQGHVPPTTSASGERVPSPSSRNFRRFAAAHLSTGPWRVLASALRRSSIASHRLVSAAGVPGGEQKEVVGVTYAHVPNASTLDQGPSMRCQRHLPKYRLRSRLCEVG